MRQPIARSAAVPVAAATCLGAVAGYVDATCFGHLFEVFPANQSGNAILLGIAIGDGSLSHVWPPLTAMVGFVFGIATAITLRRLVGSRPCTRLLLMLEMALLIGVAATVGDVAGVDELVSGLRGASVLLVAALAMGVQTEVLRTHAGVAIATTYQTGALAHIAEDMAALATDPARRRSGSPRAVAMLSAVLGGYIGGAAFGALLVSRWSGAFIVPVLVLAGLLITTPSWMPPDPATPMS